jgi:hypothetical protein
MLAYIVNIRQAHAAGLSEVLDADGEVVTHDQGLLTTDRGQQTTDN